jgi:hypothetical protein
MLEGMAEEVRLIDGRNKGEAVEQTEMRRMVATTRLLGASGTEAIPCCSWEALEVDVGSN